MIPCSNLHHTLGLIEGIGGPELLMVMVIVLILFGGKKLPEFARGLGKSMREIKKATAGVEEEFKRAMDDEPDRPRVTAPQTSVPQNPAPGSTPAPDKETTPDPKPTDETPRG